ncbi:MAG: DUF3365 domain-containing protein, partial [Deltaproteobacteria bacterium]|nr:DUF3365 domain-containing protein [Deltaproteobacteria bacterium]
MNETYRKAIAGTWAYIIAIGILFVVGTAFSLLDGIDEVREERFRLAISQADIVSRTVFAARRWAMENDDVSVSIAGAPRHNASLAVSSRTTQKVNGDGIAKVDHVSMTQFIGRILKPEGFHVHIVSRKTLHPENLPDDDWERISLEKVETGSVKEYALTGPPGNRVFRYMEPLKVDASCARCHGQQGYRIGEVRGGISIAFPYAPFEQSARRSERREIIVHLLSLVVALGILFFLGRRIVGLTKSLQETQRKVRTLEGILPMCMNCKKIRKEGAAGE